MKIRIKGNSIRLRLAQSEVTEFNSKGIVSDSINFGASQLIYTLQKDDIPTLKADFNGEFITVCVPSKQGSDWSSSNQVGIEGTMSVGKEEKLFILIEKDFQCLKPRGEDESDLYNNPLAE